MSKPKSPRPVRPPIAVPRDVPGLAPPRAFTEAVEGLGLEFEPGDIERLGRFLALMLEVNKTTNLTAIAEPDAAWMKHIFDALTLVPVLASALEARSGGEEAAGEVGAPSLVDVGSGGGVPAIPLAIVMPEVRFTLVEATAKKAAFLTAAAEQLGLPNVRVLNARAEPMGQDHKVHRERYDLATARALGHLAVVAELCAPLVRPGGFVIAVKGGRAEEELVEAGKAMGLVGLRHAETVATPTGRIVILEKTIRTPRLYPRKNGEPSRLPLGVGAKGRGG